ncbi:hypothetical protein I8H83_02520 [Candidatus Saccharibacteria bacterium]|nr:hypothetical protein [Candidatus Saccharibacteria bacterium]
MARSKENSKKLFTLELTALFIFSLVVIGNFSVTKFAEGYYSHFGVTLPEINFIPQVYDYVNVLPLTLIASAVVVLVVVALTRLSVWLGSVMAEKTKPSKKLFKFVKRHRRPFGVLVKFLEWTLKIGIWGFVLVSLVYSVNNISLYLGKVSAESKVIYSTVSNEGENTQKVIIYKSSSEVILKSYDISKGNFIDGYETLTGASYTTRSAKF